jgi:hypothetical protein
VIGPGDRRPVPTTDVIGVVRRTRLLGLVPALDLQAVVAVSRLRSFAAARSCSPAALTSSIAATLRRLTDDASDLVFLDLPRRVAKALLSQAGDDDGVIRLSLRQEELAHQAPGNASTQRCGFEKARLDPGA